MKLLILNNLINNKYFLFLSIIIILFKNFFFPGWWLEMYGYDKWLYWGSAQNLEYYKSHFSDTYYFRRWISIFPFYIFQKIFTPGNTWYILSNLSLFVTIYTFLKIVFKLTNDHYIGFFFALFIIFNLYISQRISSGHVTMIALPLFLILLENCLNILNRNQFKTIEIFFFFFIAGILIITYQGYFSLIIFFYLIFLVRIFNIYKLKEIYRFHLILIFALLTIVFFDYIIGQLIGAKWENIITFTIKTKLGLNQHSIWGAREYFKFELDYGSLFYTTILSFLTILILKKRGENDYKINFFYLYTLLTLILFYLPELVSFNKNVFSKHRFILIYLSLFINTIFLFKYLNIFSKFLTLIITLVLNFFLLKYNLNIENFTKLYIVSLFIIVFLYFLKINFLNYKKISTILVIFSITLMLSEINYKDKEFKSVSLSDHEYQINFLNELSAEVKQITKYKSSYRIWLLDRREHINNNYLARSLYYQYSQLDPEKVSVCVQLKWMSLFDNSVLLILGFEDSNKALLELKKLTINCKIKKIIKLDLNYIDAFTFKIFI